MPDNKFKSIKINGQKGFSLPELLIVVLVLAILLTLALPQIVSSRRLFKFSAMQRQMASLLVDARQEAMGQRTPVTFRYNNAAKEVRIYGGRYGALGNTNNLVTPLADSGLNSNHIVYGRPSGVSTAALDDGTNMTNLTANAIEITFQSDGSVVTPGNIPQNFTMFFYHSKYAKKTAFAISILGAGGRVKIWRYNQQTNKYIE